MKSTTQQVIERTITCQCPLGVRHSARFQRSTAFTVPRKTDNCSGALAGHSETRRLERNTSSVVFCHCNVILRSPRRPSSSTEPPEKLKSLLHFPVPWLPQAALQRPWQAFRPSGSELTNDIHIVYSLASIGEIGRAHV